MATNISSSFTEREGLSPSMISVVIVNYDTGPWLGRALEALAQQSYADFDAYIVDNASSDSSLDRAMSVVLGDGRFHFKKLKANIGFAAANNLAVRHTTSPWIALLNPDAVPTPGWLHALCEAMEKHPDVTMFGSTQLLLSDPALLDGCGDHYLFAGLPWRGGFGWPAARLPREDRDVFSPCAAAAIYRRSAFNDAGGFDESFFCYVEDVDLGFRLRLLGHRCVQAHMATVLHVGGVSSNTKSTTARFYGVRNLVWCYVKNMPAPLFWLVLPVHAVVLISLLWRSFSRGEAHIVLKAILAAFRRLPWTARRQIQSRRVVSWWAIAKALTWSPVSYFYRVP